MPKSKTPLEWIEISLATAAILAAVGYGAYRAAQPAPPRGTVCAEEAKLCPDGSYVSRQGPACEFAPCPSPMPSLSPSPAESPNAADWKTYRDNANGFEFKYPPAFTVYKGDMPDYSIGSFLKEHLSVGSSAMVNVSAAISRNSYPYTNFQAASVAIAFDPTIANISECRQFMKQGTLQNMSETKTVNGTTFYTDTAGGAAAGTLTTTKVYHALHNETCYEVDLTLITSNIGNYPAGTVEAVDETAVWNTLENILTTFKFTK